MEKYRIAAEINDETQWVIIRKYYKDTMTWEFVRGFECDTKRDAALFQELLQEMARIQDLFRPIITYGE